MLGNTSPLVIGSCRFSLVLFRRGWGFEFSSFRGATANFCDGPLGEHLITVNLSIGAMLKGVNANIIT